MAKNHTWLDDQMITISSSIKNSLYREFITFCNMKDTKPAEVIRMLVTEWVANMKSVLNADPEKPVDNPMTIAQSNAIETICNVHGIARPDTNGWTFIQACTWINEMNTKTGYKKK